MIHIAPMQHRQEVGCIDKDSGGRGCGAGRPERRTGRGLTGLPRRCWQAGEEDAALTVLWCGEADGARTVLLCKEANG